MNSDIHHKQHWSVGTYIDLMLAAIIMQIIFFFASVWVGTYGSDFFDKNLEEIQYVLRMQIGLGWMMCIIAGLGFSILPLIYDVPGFEKTVMRIYVTMNMSGQFAIMFGIVSRDIAVFHTLSTIGLTLLCGSLICLISPAMTIFKSKKIESDTMGAFSYSIGAIMPILGIVTIICWIARDYFNGVLKISEALVFDFFIPLAIIATIISHINRRLDWEIIKPSNTGKSYGIFTILLLLAVISEPLSNSGDISMRINATLSSLPYFFIFIMLNPKQIITKIKQGNPYSKMVITAIFWLPFIGIASYMEIMQYVETTKAMMSYYRWILIFGFSFQALWGFAAFLHDDHKRVSIHRRKSQWLILVTINLGTLVTIYSMFSSWYSGEILIQYPRYGIALYALSYILILIYWLKDIFFSIDDWHKIPLYYDQYLAHPEQGSGFDLELSND